MLPSSIARQVAGTFEEQLIHLRLDLARYAAATAQVFAPGRGERLPEDLKDWLLQMGLPLDTKAPKPVRSLLDKCHGRFGDGRKTMDLALMAGVSDSTAREALRSLLEQGWVTSEVKNGVTGRALFWMEVK